MLLATYTGVLIGVTAIPAWFLHHKLLPIHFGAAGLGSAAALLELLGHRIAPLNAIGLFAAAVETVLLIWLSVDKHGVADRAIHEHGSGWLIRIGEVFTARSRLCCDSSARSRWRRFHFYWARSLVASVGLR